MIKKLLFSGMLCVLSMPIIFSMRRAKPIKKAVSKGCLSEIKRLVHERNVNARDAFGRTLLHYACRSTRVSLEMIKLLLEKGADPDMLDNFDESPLLFALKNKRADISILELLIFLTLKHINTPSQKGDTPLTVACRLRSPEIIKKLIEAGVQESVNIANAIGQTPLCLAIIYQDYATIKYLLEHGAIESANKREMRGRTPIFYLVKREEKEDAKLRSRALLEKIFLRLLGLSDECGWVARVFIVAMMKGFGSDIQEAKKELREKKWDLEVKREKYAKLAYDPISWASRYSRFAHPIMWKYFYSDCSPETLFFGAAMVEYKIGLVKKSYHDVLAGKVQRLFESLKRESRADVKFEFLRLLKQVKKEGVVDLVPRIRKIREREAQRRIREKIELERIIGKKNEVEAILYNLEYLALKKAAQKVKHRKRRLLVRCDQIETFLEEQKAARWAKVNQAWEDFNKN